LKIYLHTDDFAATAGMTEGMLDRWRNGYLDGFSIMANGDARAAGAAALAADAGRTARLVGHLNLTEGASATEPGKVPLLVDAQGRLRHSFASLALLWLLALPSRRRALIGQVEIEWRAQIRQLEEIVAPRRLSGVDGHVHVHMLPFLFPIAARLARESGIPMIRISKEPFHLERGWRDLLVPPVLVNLVKHVILRACARGARAAALENGLQAPEFVLGVMYSGRMTAAAALAGIAAAGRRNAASVEVVFHVGRATDAERARWGERREFADFPCSPQRDVEFAEIAVLHQRLRESGLRAP